MKVNSFLLTVLLALATTPVFATEKPSPPVTPPPFENGGDQKQDQKQDQLQNQDQKAYGGDADATAIGVNKNSNSNKAYGGDADSHSSSTGVGIGVGTGGDAHSKSHSDADANSSSQVKDSGNSLNLNSQNQKTEVGVKNGNDIKTTDVNDVDNKQVGIVKGGDQKQVGIQATDASSKNANLNGNKNQTGDQKTTTLVDASDKSVNVIKTEIDAREDARDTSVNIDNATPGITSLTIYNACGIPLSSTNVAAKSNGVGFGLSQFGGLGGSFGVSWQSFNDQQKGLLEQMNMQITTNVQQQIALGSSWAAMRPIAKNSYASMFRRTTDMKDSEIKLAVAEVIASLDAMYSTQAKWEATQTRVATQQALLCGAEVKTTTVVETPLPEYVPTTPTKATPSIKLNPATLF